MLTGTLIGAAVAFAQCVNGASLAKRDTEDETVKFLPISLSMDPDFLSVPLTIGNSTNSTMHLKLDTSSNGVWVNSETNEFCQAAYPLHSLANESAWNIFNDELRAEFLDNLASFQSAQKSQLQTIVGPSKTVSYEPAVTIFSQRQSSFSAYLGNQKSSLSSELLEFASSHSAEWSSLKSKLQEEGETIASEATRVGNAIATRAESFGGEVTSFGGQLATKVTSVAVSDIGGPVTAWGESVASDITSGFGDFTAGAASRFGDLTSGLLNIFRRDDATSSSTPTSTITPKSSYPVPSTTYKFVPSATALASALPMNDTMLDWEYYEMADCSIYGTFNGSDSFVANDTIYISENGEVVGLVGNDTFFFANGTVSNVTFAVAEVSESNIGSFGLGQKTENSTLLPFAEQLVENGIIEKALYSLELSQSNPNVIFGAINYDAFSGNLTLLPLLNSSEAIAVTLSSFGISYADDEEDIIYDLILAEGAAYANLDTTVQDIYLPFEALNALVITLNDSYPISFNETFGRYVISVANTTDDSKIMKNASYPMELEDINLAFHFQGFPLDLPLIDLLVPIAPNETFYFNDTSNTNQSYYYYSPSGDEDTNSTDYILSVLPSDSDEAIFGLSFLQDVYLVVDLESQVVGMAPLNDSYVEDIEESDLTIIAISDSIPLAVNATYFDEYYGNTNVTSLLPIFN